ncbi:hypothetical protein BA065_03250, partial [Nanoarchaeota archaeon NZ13-N]
MLDREDIEKIIEKVNQVKKMFSEESLSIETVDLDSIEGFEDEVTYIDSSYVSGIVGPLSYIYARAIAVSSTNEIKKKDFLLVPDILIEVFEENKKKSMEISSIANLVSKNLEYKLLDEVKSGYIVIDGSILSDYILFGKFDSSPVEEINRRIQEFKENFLKSTNRKMLSIAKRILHSKFLGDNRPDFIVLLNKFPYERFCTRIFTKDLEDFRVKALYIRSQTFDHIYRVEAWDKLSDEEILGITKNIFNKVSYP